MATISELKKATGLIASARTPEDLRNAWAEAAKLLDFSYGTVVSLMNIHGSRDWRYMATTAPKDYMEWYDASGMIADDPIVRRLFETMEPFYSDQLDRPRLNSAMRKFIWESVKHGMVFAAGASHRSADGFITFGIFTKLIPFVRDREKTLTAVQWFVSAAHEALMRMAREDAMRKRANFATTALTDQEKDVLTLMARGFMRKRIGLELDMKERTVAYCADSAAEKMGAQDRNVAVKQALLEREITMFQPPARWSASDSVISKPESCKPSGGLRRETFDLVLHCASASASLGELSTNLGTVCQALGFDRYSLVLRMATPKAPKQYVITNLPASLQALGEDAQQLTTNPMVGGDLVRPGPGWTPGVGGSCALRKDAGGRVQAISLFVRDARGAHSTVTFLKDNEATTDDAFEVEYAAQSAVRVIHEAATRVSREENAGDYLTPREADCLMGAAHNETPEETAKHLGITVSTVRHALSAAAHKLGVNTTKEALCRATELGLLNGHVRRESIEDTDMVAVGTG